MPLSMPLPGQQLFKGLCVVLSVLVSIDVGNCNSNGTNCYEAYECASGGPTNGIQELSSLRCYGYFSCFDRNSLMTTSNDIECYGSHSCRNAESLTTENYNGVNCYGLSSCENVMAFDQITWAIGCYGDRSCYNSTFINVYDIYCYGDRSCANSFFEVTDSTYTYVYGYLGLANSTFSVAPDEYLRLSVYGPLGAENVEILLDSNSYCRVICYGPDSCKNINVNCKDSTCDYNFNWRCDNYLSFTPYCGNGYSIIDQDTVFPDISNIIESNHKNSVDICQNSNAVCNHYNNNNGICNNNTISSSNTICCSAYDACDNAGTIKTTTTNNIAIRCDGYNSCRDYNAYITTVNGGDVYIAGYNALSNSGSVIESASSNVVCSGYDSCYYTKFIDVKNVYCTGYYSCSYADFYNITNLYMYSRFDWICCNIGDGSKVNNIAGDMYINAHDFGTLSLITNVAGNMYVTGLNNLDNTRITNINGIVVQGYDNMYGAVIRGFNFVNATGGGSEYILRYSTLISESPSGTTTVVLNITETIQLDFYCNQTDTCNVECYKSDACLDLTVYCYGDCYVLCDFSSDIKCPKLGAGEYNLQLSDSTYGLVSSGVNTECHDAFGCQNLDGYVASSLECYGYSSCSDGNEIVFIASDNSIECYGSYSCSKTSIATYDDGVVSCYGLESCSSIPSIIGHRINCYGELSCYNSSIQATNLLSCYGDRSCAYSEITVPCCDSFHWQQVYVFGSYGAANSIFDIGSVSYGDNDFYISSITTTYGPTTTRAPDDTDIYRVTDIYIYLYGAAAAYNSVFYCGFGKRCIFICAGANSCAQLTWYCGSQYDYSSDNAGCTVFILCDDIEIEDFVLSDAYTPTTQQSGDFCVTSSILSFATSSQISTNALDTCDTSKDDSNTEICDDYQECSDNTISISDSNGDAHICCTGSSSCETVNSIIVTDSSASSTNLVRCDGYQSCNQVSSFSATGGGNFYFSSSNAMDGATVTSDTSGSNVYCTAASSCQDGIFSELSTVICSGYDSCANAMINNVNYVYQLGAYSSEDVAPTMENIDNNVYCGARSSCEDSTISNVAGVVYGLGDSALRSATLTSINELVIEGYRGFYASSITGIATIKATGDESLDWSEIISDLNGGEMILSIDMTETENAFFVTCSSGDTCDIYCLSTIACKYMVLYCYGSCEAFCDDSNGVACPNGADGTSYTRVGNFTLPPTEEPSVPPGTPTSMPTESSEGGSKNDGNNNNNEMDLTLIIIICASCLTIIVLAIIIVTYLKSKNKSENNVDNQVQLVDQTSPKSPAAGATLTPGGITIVSQPGLVGVGNVSGNVYKDGQRMQNGGIPVNPLDRHVGETTIEYAEPATN